MADEPDTTHANLPLSDRSCPPDIVIFGQFRKSGGTWRRLTNQMYVWAEMGLRVELVGWRDSRLFYPDETAQLASYVPLKARSKWLAAFLLYRYLLRVRPRTVLATHHRSNLVLAACAALPGVRSRLYASVPNTFGASEGRTPRERKRKFAEVRRHYPRCDGVIAVSHGVRDDLLQNVGLRGVDIRTIYNGSITARMKERAREPVDHPWLAPDHAVPVVVTVGAIRGQKDYPTLLRAIAHARERIDCRLIVLADTTGNKHQHLLDLANELGVAAHTDFVGHRDNPYAWMARSDLFALSSAWEGMVNVVAEALGLGLPIVSTDCPSSPREILADGRYGRLVPVGDWQALGDALVQSLQTGPANVDLQLASQPFEASTAAAEYAAYFGLIPAHRGAVSERNP